jgi:hypothetical protein
MTDPASLAEIIAAYEKHGWVLRRVLLSNAARTALGPMTDSLSAKVPVMDSDIDAAWFSRPPKSGGVAWEIRYLGQTPFALLENIDESNGDLEARLSAVEERLRASVAAKKPA